jgi:hypothetical protein
LSFLVSGEDLPRQDIAFGLVPTRKRRRGSGGHRAKVAERRSRERARRARGSRESVLKRTVSVACREALQCETALDAELWASALLGSWWPGHVQLEADEPDLEVGGPLVEEMGRRGDAGALAAMIGLAEVSDSELGPGQGGTLTA